MRRALALAALMVTAGAHAVAAPPAAKALDGVWTLGTYTDFQRPKELEASVLTPAEAEAYEAPRRALRGMLREKDEELGQSESEFNERGHALTRVNGQIRASWIVDPADGRIPYNAETKARLGLEKEKREERRDNPEDLSGMTRCLTNQAAGAPMMGAPDTNLFEIVTTPDHVAILTEKYHEVRIVRLGAAERPDPRAGDWIGHSTGRWEGDTLVVETTGFRPGDTGRGAGLYLSGRSRVTERFTRLGPGALLYRFTVEDPALYTQVWRGEIVLDKARGRIFEFACHEGNYALPNILGGARYEEATAKAQTTNASP
ncbi:MAG: hypothetical protein JNL41_15075 [Phenylobacterium sp.]|uniref:hypothetical protein n=1 Tax=Phenylobacterium sp. TaxID=1871053 RepID=UPI001A3C6B70|nr:hypothetical protein [Phenylobacterium sp.]MBL8555594.1 hypothetical protein [Phenylobacterium sp.]